jgi:RNA polymerase sigma factor (sigma-70 family)
MRYILRGVAAFEPTRLSLLSRVRDPGNAAAWREFEERYRPLLLRFCLNRGVQIADAEDVVQLVLAAMARVLPTFEYDAQRGRFRSYLFRCTANAIVRVRARPTRGPTALVMDEVTLDGLAQDGAEPSDPQAERQWEREWVAHHYRLALAAVSEQCDERSIRVFERCLSGSSPEAIANEFSMSVDAVYKVRQRVRQRMQEQIAQQVREEDEIGR